MRLKDDCSNLARAPGWFPNAADVTEVESHHVAKDISDSLLGILSRGLYIYICSDFIVMNSGIMVDS